MLILQSPQPLEHMVWATRNAIIADLTPHNLVITRRQPFDQLTGLENDLMAGKSVLGQNTDTKPV